ncbi:IclR family transcriptional regulator C-terminal domain-containing protein [Streptomyces sp. G-G2]|uniref:IclR family transcriptional regulator n=1 Tax=Streptomyces sp. G-G2 TaxID=3046201 RepID=UPI0024B93607|nr:IclR family transcriptional regulator C-terminal domain-containing protein [Streptomyces sp. G-G2]MDJ0382253.1 IclR family transcriptional regulator C-terminal domain-containing protein [Streptomyces sp. G-G2]
MKVVTQQPRISGVGVLDKASVLLAIVEDGPATLAELVTISGLTRPTAHRIAQALERLDLLTRDHCGRYVLGTRLGNIAVEAQRDRLVRAALPVLADLAALTGLDARIFRRRGEKQFCVATSVDPLSLTDCIPVGTARPAKAGAASQVLLAWEEPEELYEGLRGARFTAAQLALVRRRGWAHGPDTAVPEAVSIAVPVRAKENRVVCALVLTGKRPRMPAEPNRALLGAVIDAASRLCDVAGNSRAPGTRAAV